LINQLVDSIVWIMNLHLSNITM